jgi:mono/diheme cytochrome c family protein
VPLASIFLFFSFFCPQIVCENFSMSADTRPNPRARQILFVVILAVAAVAISYAISENRPWRIPEEAKHRQNPIQASPAALASAAAIYRDKCANCHGDSGKGDGPDAASYYPRPASLADAKHMNSLTDGEIFYQISQGKKPMPAFKRKLTEEQRWELVLFVRTFAATGTPAH